MDGNEVSLLWMAPITKSERTLAETSGSKALLAKLDGSTLHIIGGRM
jgi:hypothetical protein